MTPRSLDVRRLGLVEYGAGLEMQAGLVEERRSGAIGDTMLLLEHPPVITLGVKTRGKHANIVASPEVLAAEGVSVSRPAAAASLCGPGQLVRCPIFDLRPDRCVHRYVRDIEEALIIALCELALMVAVWLAARASGSDTKGAKRKSRRLACESADGSPATDSR